MPVFDFNASTDNKNLSECTYQIFRSNHGEATPEKPIMILDNKVREWKHHSSGMFTNPVKRTSFEFDEEEGVMSADILKIDARFTSLLKWLGENHIKVRLSGKNTEDGYAVYKIREIAFGGGTKLSAEAGFLQFMIERLLASDAPSEEVVDEDADEVALCGLQEVEEVTHALDLGLILAKDVGICNNGRVISICCCTVCDKSRVALSVNCNLSDFMGDGLAEAVNVLRHKCDNIAFLQCGRINFGYEDKITCIEVGGSH